MNSQPLVLGLQLPVHGQREAEEAPGVPRFPDHIVLAGVQVEGGAEPGQQPRRQVEQPQPPHGRHGKAGAPGRERELRGARAPGARVRVRGCGAAATGGDLRPLSPPVRPHPRDESRSRPGRSPSRAAPTAE